MPFRDERDDRWFPDWRAIASHLVQCLGFACADRTARRLTGMVRAPDPEAPRPHNTTAKTISRLLGGLSSYPRVNIAANSQPNAVISLSEFLAFSRCISNTIIGAKVNSKGLRKNLLPRDPLAHVGAGLWGGKPRVAGKCDIAAILTTRASRLAGGGRRLARDPQHRGDALSERGLFEYCAIQLLIVAHAPIKCYEFATCSPRKGSQIRVVPDLGREGWSLRVLSPQRLETCRLVSERHAGITQKCIGKVAKLLAARRLRRQRLWDSRPTEESLAESIDRRNSRRLAPLRTNSWQADDGRVG